MITIILIIGSAMVGMYLGFWLNDWMISTPTPTRPEALTATPEDIVAVYEARREMKEHNAPRPPLNLRGGETEKEKELNDIKAWRRVYDDPSLKLWEQEQNKKERKRR